MRDNIVLNQWTFALGDTASCLEKGREVTIPHTWNIEENTEEFYGNGWYEHRFFVPKEWESKRIRVHFKGAYHSAYVYVNDQQVGEHLNSGYTPFTVELTKGIIVDAWNVLRVRVNNEFSEDMLPYKRSFDWANDGGLIRGVELILSGSHFIDGHSITAEPVITSVNERQDAGHALFAIEGVIDGTNSGADDEALGLTWELYRGCDDALSLVQSGEADIEQSHIVMDKQWLLDIIYWHFDRPVLYTVKLVLTCGDRVVDSVDTVIGFREFRVEGTDFYLNGEKVRLCGTEWMPGSNPEIGLAESKEQLEKMIISLKETNCIFTRFHWQQDDIVYDWCDRHGMLVQEEVPFWGKDPIVAGEKNWKIYMQQMDEMQKAHRNHPSIIAWGVGNELDGQADETIRYIRQAVAYAHAGDPSRTANYVSNTVIRGHLKDGVSGGDLIMINDYIGTWHGDLDQMGEIAKMIDVNPDKPLVPSEFGLCEPAFEGGDPERIRIYLDKMTAYRQFPEIAGTINFCLNDYRTQMGEDGEGKIRKRIHGSADLYGNPKPSYYVVQKETAPFTIEREGDRGTLTCRGDLPSYMMKGYVLFLVNDLDITIDKITIPDLKPGDTFSFDLKSPDNAIDIYRENGDYTGRY